MTEIIRKPRLFSLRGYWPGCERPANDALKALVVRSGWFDVRGLVPVQKIAGYAVYSRYAGRCSGPAILVTLRFKITSFFKVQKKGLSTTDHIWKENGKLTIKKPFRAGLYSHHID
ncbi:hypothetical protein JFT58_06405 [Pseudomonas sp. MF6767]|uniref:hypothetical protein n=1 Tax=Pseudomonas sp. MF6767 TaxID=2797531 RepID=UPI0018E7DAAD|nr:hypothetical protein [Pseudomonas sp. MF6767]MBJ2277911.1 hypothetical protein [Pseudomonas sp. MF6767]